MRSIVAVILLLGTTVGFGEVFLTGEYPVPTFKSDTPTAFTDLCLDNTGTMETLAVCSEGGYGQFPLIEGYVRFEPPGFIADTGNYVIRGYAATPAGLSALESRGRFVFWGKQAQLPLPSAINGTLTGMAWDGKLLWIAERSGRLIGLNPNGGQKLETVVTHILDIGAAESVTWHDGTLWVTDGSRLVRLDGTGRVSRTWLLPEMVNGICFVDGNLYATAAYKKSILKFKVK